MRFRYCCAITAAIMINACQQQAEQAPPAEAGAAHYNAEKGQPHTAVALPSAAEVQALLALQDRVAQQPNEMTVRRELGQEAINTAAGVVWTVGRGRLRAGAASIAVARNQAELAARIDATRWAAYLLDWHKNNYSTNYGSIQAHAPGGEVANTSCDDSTCVVLLKTILQ